MDPVELRQLREEDSREVARLYSKNRNNLQKFEPVRTDEHFTVEWQRQQIFQAAENDTIYMMGLFVNGRLAGRINLSRITRGAFMNGGIGYWLDQDMRGKGYMSQGVSLMLAFAFETVKLHRVEAGILPWNEASRKVLAGCGFERIGRARRYLEINGVWEDHDLYQITREDWPGLSLKD